MKKFFLLLSHIALLGGLFLNAESAMDVDEYHGPGDQAAAAGPQPIMQPGIDDNDSTALANHYINHPNPTRWRRFLRGLFNNKMKNAIGAQAFTGPEANFPWKNWEAAVAILRQKWRQGQTLLLQEEVLIDIQEERLTMAKIAFRMAQILAFKGIYPSSPKPPLLDGNLENFREEVLEMLKEVDNMPVKPAIHYNAQLWAAIIHMDGYNNGVWGPRPNNPLTLYNDDEQNEAWRNRLEKAWDLLTAARQLRDNHTLSKTVALWQSLIISEMGLRPFDQDVPEGEEREDLHKRRAQEFLEFYSEVEPRAQGHHVNPQPPQTIREEVDGHQPYKGSDEAIELEARAANALAAWDPDHGDDHGDDQGPDQGGGDDDDQGGGDEGDGYGHGSPLLEWEYDAFQQGDGDGDGDRDGYGDEVPPLEGADAAYNNGGGDDGEEEAGAASDNGGGDDGEEEAGAASDNGGGGDDGEEEAEAANSDDQGDAAAAAPDLTLLDDMKKEISLSPDTKFTGAMDAIRFWFQNDKTKEERYEKYVNDMKKTGNKKAIIDQLYGWLRKRGQIKKSIKRATRIDYEPYLTSVQNFLSEDEKREKFLQQYITLYFTAEVMEKTNKPDRNLMYFFRENGCASFKDENLYGAVNTTYRGHVREKVWKCVQSELQKYNCFLPEGPSFRSVCVKGFHTLSREEKEGIFAISKKERPDELRKKINIDSKFNIPKYKEAQDSTIHLFLDEQRDKEREDSAKTQPKNPHRKEKKSPQEAPTKEKYTLFMKKIQDLIRSSPENIRSQDLRKIKDYLIQQNHITQAEWDQYESTYTFNSNLNRWKMQQEQRSWMSKKDRAAERKTNPYDMKRLEQDLETFCQDLDRVKKFKKYYEDAFLTGIKMENRLSSNMFQYLIKENVVVSFMDQPYKIQKAAREKILQIFRTNNLLLTEHSFKETVERLFSELTPQDQQNIFNARSMPEAFRSRCTLPERFTDAALTDRQKNAQRVCINNFLGRLKKNPQNESKQPPRAAMAAAHEEDDDDSSGEEDDDFDTVQIRKDPEKNLMAQRKEIRHDDGAAPADPGSRRPEVPAAAASRKRPAGNPATGETALKKKAAQAPAAAHVAKPKRPRAPLGTYDFRPSISPQTKGGDAAAASRKRPADSPATGQPPLQKGRFR